MRESFSALLKALAYHFRICWNTRVYAGALLWMAAITALNYALDLEDSLIDTEPSHLLRWWWMVMLHAIPWLGISALYALAGVMPAKCRSLRFWVVVFAGFSILAFDRSCSIQVALQQHLQGVDFAFLYKVANQFKGAVTVIIPLVLLSLVAGRDFKNNFGLRGGQIDLKMYAVLLLLAMTAIGAGGMFSDLQAFYPRYLRTAGPAFAELHDLPQWVAMLMYELPYGFDFISTEYFFRGFLVIGLSRWLGQRALLPMAAAYMALHFGKPLTETISSAFGGYLLGILALHHRNIWGGVVIHVGVAWCMELVGYLHRVFG